MTLLYWCTQEDALASDLDNNLKDHNTFFTLYSHKKKLGQKLGHNDKIFENRLYGECNAIVYNIIQFVCLKETLTDKGLLSPSSAGQDNGHNICVHV